MVKHRQLARQVGAFNAIAIESSTDLDINHGDVTSRRNSSRHLLFSSVQLSSSTPPTVPIWFWLEEICCAAVEHGGERKLPSYRQRKGVMTSNCPTFEDGGIITEPSIIAHTGWVSVF